MPREKKLELGAINITMHPHSPIKYVELFKEVKNLRNIQHIHSDKYGMLTSVNYLDKKKGETSPITGDLYRFTNIKVDGQWFNIDTYDKAEEEELGEVKIPKNLKPNSSRFSYLFFPEDHLLFYECYYDGNKLGPTNATKLVDRLFNQQEINDKYGKIEVTHVPCVDALSKALGMKKLEKLDLHITRPNPDDQSDAERKFLKRMNKLKVAEQKQEYKAIPGESIELDEELKTLTNIAAKNGEVSAKGKDELSKPVFYSTSKHPWIDKLYYDPNVESPFDMFVLKAMEVKDEILSWFKRPG
ncbi:DUF4747 family protein [Aliidiomarina celeris]|uniref:DUF4747 family protein n=1 Tax=Aliidiomarina celeris TaxID=2249428 RepID=UPI000DEB7F2D|nr:DUF4747 family protein [Aliidiomarina celeris]